MSNNMTFINDVRNEIDAFEKWIDSQKDTYEKYLICFVNVYQDTDDCWYSIDQVNLISAYNYVKESIFNFKNSDMSKVFYSATKLFSELTDLDICIYRLDKQKTVAVYPTDSRGAEIYRGNKNVCDIDIRYYLDKIVLLRNSIKDILGIYSSEYERLRSVNITMTSQIDSKIKSYINSGDIESARKFMDGLKQFIENN